MADSDETTTSSDFVSNWSSSGGFWDRVRGSGTPSLNAGTLVKTSAGSSVMLFLYAVIATIRSWITGAVNSINSLFDFFGDVVSVLYGDGVTVPSGDGSVTVPGFGDFVDGVFRSAASGLSSQALGFLIAVALVFALATLVWGVRRYAL